MNKCYFGLPAPDEIQVFKNDLHIEFNENTEVVIKDKEETIKKAIKEDGTVDLNKIKEENKKADTIKFKELNVEFSKKEANAYSISTYITKSGEEKAVLNKVGLINLIINKLNPIWLHGSLYVYTLDGVYKKTTKEYLKTIIQTIMPKMFLSNAVVRELADLITTDYRVNKTMNEYSSVFNKNVLYLNCKNGILNLKTLELEPHTSNFLSNIQVKANYNKEAKSELFENFLNKIVPDKDVQKVLQEVIGYGLTMLDNSKEKIFIFHGDSNTGKTTLLNVTLNSLLPQTARSSVSLQQIETDRFALAYLVDKTANIFDDLKSEVLKDTGILKVITGRGTANAEKKGVMGVETKFPVKLYFSTNHMPTIAASDKSNGFYDRIKIFTFNQKVSKNEQIHNLQELLQQEEHQEAILKWAIEGINRLINNGFKFSFSQAIEDNIKEYKNSNNSLAQFIEEYCEVTNKRDDYINVNRFMKEYNNFCKNELEQTAIGKTNVIKQLETIYSVNKIKQTKIDDRGKRPYIFVGIKFKEELLLEEDNVEKNWAKIAEHHEP